MYECQIFKSIPFPTNENDKIIILAMKHYLMVYKDCNNYPTYLDKNSHDPTTFHFISPLFDV